MGNNGLPPLFRMACVAGCRDGPGPHGRDYAIWKMKVMIAVTAGAITVVESSTLRFRPRFVASRSYFEYAGHVLPVTLGEATPLPSVVVALVSSSHVFPNSSFGVTSPLLQMRMEIQGGTLAPNGTTTLFRPIVDDVAVFDGVAIREGAAPNLEFCGINVNC